MRCDLSSSAELMFTDTFTRDLGLINQELLDSGIDLIFEDDIIDSIPIVKSISKIAKLGLSVRDYSFTKKALKFLSVSSEIPIDERKKFVKRIENDKKYRTRLGEVYINCIEKARDTENAEQVGHLSNACIKGVIDFDDFLRCVNIITTISSGGLRDFVLLNREDISRTAMDEIVYSGLYRIRVTPIFVDVMDDEELKKKKELEKTNNPFTIPIHHLDRQINDVLFNIFPFSALPAEVKSKYHVNTDGGNIEYYTSEIGAIIKDVLGDYYNS